MTGAWLPVISDRSMVIDPGLMFAMPPPPPVDVPVVLERTAASVSTVPGEVLRSPPPSPEPSCPPVNVTPLMVTPPAVLATSITRSPVSWSTIVVRAPPPSMVTGMVMSRSSVLLVSDPVIVSV
jgi:hypothetical protein